MAQKEEIIVAVSGGFDPVHVGHIQHFKEAKALGDRLVVILSGDEWLLKKKGYVFMPLHERIEVIKSIRYVDEVVVREPSEDMSVNHMLAKLPIHIFAKGGDRTADNIPEISVCDEKGIRIVYGVGGADKPQSSSWLAENVVKHFSSSGKLRETGKGI